MSSVASYQQAVEYIEWSGRVFVQLYLEDTIRKSDLNLGIMAEGQGQRGFAETASAAQRGSNCCGLAALLVEEEMLDGVKDFGTRDVALGQVSGLKVPRTGWESSRLSSETRDQTCETDTNILVGTRLVLPHSDGQLVVW